MEIAKLLDKTRCFFEFSFVNLLEKTQIGLDNQTYKLEADGQNYFLSGSTNDIATKQRQLEWVDFLALQGFPVVELIKPRKNNCFILTHADYQWHMMREARGQTVQKYNAKQSYALGEMTGKLHHYGRNYISSDFKADYYKADIQHWHDLYLEHRDLFSLQEQNTLDTCFAWCFNAELHSIPHFFVHDDLFRSNVLWQNDNISCLIDFNSSRTAYYTEDFSKAFDSVIEEKTTDNENAFSFMTGYNKHFKIEENHVPSIVFFLTLDLLKIIACWCRDFEQIKKRGQHPRDLIYHFENIAEKEKFLYQNI